MGLYVGLEVSQKQTWSCVVDDKGKTVAEGCSLTRASDVYGWLGKARVAVARKLAITLHKMWINGQDFQWETVPKEELEVAQAF